METTDTLEITRSYNLPAGSPVTPYTSINASGKDLDELIYSLGKGGISIKTEDSEEKVTYFIIGERRESMVPLLTAFKDCGDLRIKVMSYILRGDNLEGGRITLTLEDCCKRESNAPPGTRGGTVKVTTGIVANIECEGENSIQVIQSIKELLKSFYVP